MRPEGTFALVAHRRRVIAVFAALVALVAGLGVIPGLTSSASAAVIDGVTLTTTFDNYGLVTPGVATRGTTTVTNGSNTDLADASINLIAVDADLSATTALDDWLTSADGARGQIVGSAAVGNVAAGVSVTTNIALDPNLSGWSDAWGTRALLVTLVVDDEVVAREHAVVVLNSGLPPHAARLAVIAPLVMPGETSATVSPEALEQATGQNGALSLITAVALKSPLTLAIDPRIPVSIIRQPDETPTSLQWWQSVTAAEPPAFATAYGDADLAGQIQAGATSLLSAGAADVDTSVASFLAAQGLDEKLPATPVSPVATANSASSPTPTPSPVPAADSWWSRLTTTAWPAAGTLNSATVTAITEAGYERLLVSGGNVATPSGSSASASVDGIPTLITNDRLSSAMVRAAASDSSFESNVSEVLAWLATASTDPASQHAGIAALSRNPEPKSVGNLDRLMSVLAGVSWVSLEPLDSLALPGGVAATIREGREDETRLTTIHGLLQRHGAVVEFATIGEVPELISNPVARQIMTTLGVGNMGDKRWGAAVDASTASINRTLTGVHVATGSVINMIGSTASLPLSIENDLNTAVSVIVSAVPRNSRLSVDASLPIKVESRAQAVAKLPAVAHVSNGSVLVDVSLTSAGGLPVGSSRAVSVSIHADWETIGLVVLGAVFLGLVGAGVYRTLRRRKVELSS